MLDVLKIREDFPMLKKTMHGKPLIYLDNGATTLKPQCVIDSVCDYLTNYSGNAHRGDYDLSHEVDTKFEYVRSIVADFIHCKPEEVVYTYGSSDSLNMVAFGYGVTHLKVTEHTKIISLAQITNVLGYLAPIKEICNFAHEHDIIVCVDGAQSAPHHAVDVQDLDVDFFAFSGHKMCGPTGVGVLYGKYHLLDEMTPTRFGGGSNARYNSCGLVKLKNAPTKFETGTPNIEGVIGLGSAIEYLQNIGMKNIEEHDGVGAIAFNIKNVFSQDGASLFNTYGIAIRAGQHCAKILDEYLHVSQTLRASFYFYNTKEEIDQFIEVCKKGDDFLDAFFG